MAAPITKIHFLLKYTPSSKGHLRLSGVVSQISRNICLSSCSNKKSQVTPKFVDFWQLQLNGGSGGHGLARYGGIGGHGGDVVVKASKKVKTLRDMAITYPNQKCRGSAGACSNKFHLIGVKGSDVSIEVPVGVLVHPENGKIIDLDKEGDNVVVARGGRGGNTKTNFLGLKGDSKLVGFELKLLADVGLVGFPNAGKSTFLRAVSKATPKVAAYPFTTLTPQLGLMEYEDGRKISVADLPGLIEGSNQNFGKGFKFLRHAERNKMLLFVLDLNPFQLSSKYTERSAFETLLLLIQELDLYGHGILDKPAVLAINKTDTDPDGLKAQRLIELINNLPESMETVSEEMRPDNLIKFDDIITMSAQKKDNVQTVMNRVREVMDEAAERELQEEMEERNFRNYEDSEEHLGTTFV